MDEKNGRTKRVVKEVVFWGLGIALGAAVAFAIVHAVDYVKKANRNEIDLADYHDSWKTMQGFTTLYNGQKLDYYFMTFDGGKAWYVIDREEVYKTGKIVIEGDVRLVYPGLLEQMQKIDSVVNKQRRVGSN